MRRARSFPWCLHPEAETCRPLGATPESLLAYARGGDHASASVPLQEPTRVGVLVVDDQTPFRRVALEVVEATPGFEPLGEAASGEEALALVAQLSPELILLDVRMPVMDGIETARRLSAVHPGGVVVLISIDDPAELPDAVGSCGAKALIRKQDFGSVALCRLWDAHGDTNSRASHRARP